MNIIFAHRVLIPRLVKNFCRKFVLNNNRLVGALFLGKNLNKKKLKPLIKKAVFNMVDGVQI